MITEGELVTTVKQALELLVRPWGSSSIAVVDLVLEPVLIVRHFRGPYDSLSSQCHYPIERQVVDALIALQYVRGTPRLGYTDDKVLQPTELGVAARWAEESVGEREAG